MAMAMAATAMQAVLRAPSLTAGYSIDGNGTRATSASCIISALPLSLRRAPPCSSCACNSMLGSRDLHALQGARRYSSRSMQARSRAVSPRAENAEEGANSLDIWLGRTAMLAFVGAIGLEIFSGRGLLETAGVVTPAPSAALAIAAAVGAVTAFGIFRAGSRD